MIPKHLKGQWQTGETTKCGPNLFSNKVGLSSVNIAGSYNWKDENTLELTLRYIESPHAERMACHFDQNCISVDIENSQDFGRKKMLLTGESMK